MGFVRNQDPIFPAYRYLAGAPGVSGSGSRLFLFHLPGYYYLHRKIPFYDEFTGRDLNGTRNGFFPGQSHRIRGPRLFRSQLLPGARIRPSSHLRRDRNEPPVRPWWTTPPS